MSYNFEVRTSKPTAKDKYIKFYNNSAKSGYSKCITGSPTDSTCNVLSNCVGYACSRFNEIYAILTNTTTMKYPTLNCNAEDWIERAQSLGLKTGSTPAPGAIMVWRKGNAGNSKDGAGHVAIVEQVIDSNTVYTSESGYGNKTPFWNSTRSNSNGNWGINSPYVFRAFIYNPAVSGWTMPTSTGCGYAEPTYSLTRAAYEKKANSGVKWLQWHLKELKIYTDKIDGYYGPKTETAVKTFQNAHCDCNGKNLTVDGKCGPLTRAAIKAVYNGKSLPRVSTTTTTTTTTTKTTTTTTTTFAVGDKVKLSSDAVYSSGKTIPSWVKKTSPLYVRSVPKDGVVIFSTVKTGAVTGKVNVKYLTKI